MLARMSVLALTLAFALSLAGCATPAETPEPATPPAEQPGSGAAGDPATGAMLAFGLHELEDGTAQAVGMLEYDAELEGGVWRIVGGTAAEGNEGEVFVVIANADAFSGQLEKLKGMAVMANGTLLDGASIRMAGPEMEISAIEAVSDTVEPAQ